MANDLDNAAIAQQLEAFAGLLDLSGSGYYTSRAYRRRDLLRLVLLGPLDLVLYRPLIIWARAKGTWRFLRRDTGWHKFERNARAAPGISS